MTTQVRSAIVIAALVVLVGIVTRWARTEPTYRPPREPPVDPTPLERDPPDAG